MTIREAQIISVYTGVTLFDGEDIHLLNDIPKMVHRSGDKDGNT